MKLGFFDSGKGGEIIMRAVQKELPQYSYMYYGDTKNLPFGDKNEQDLYEYTKQGVEYLFQNDAALVVVACNSSSAESVRKLQDTYVLDTYPDRKVLGVVVPTVEEVLDQKLKHVLLIGTKRTISSGKYNAEFERQSIRSIELKAVEKPQLVPLIEENKISEAYDLILDTLSQHVDSGGDGVMLGCTHYCVLKDMIRDRYGDVLEVISQDEIIPKKLKSYLNKHTELEQKLLRNNSQSIHEEIFYTHEM